MPATSLNTDELATLAFLSGVNQDGTVAANSYWTWNSDNPATYDGANSSAHKWHNDASGQTVGTTSAAGSSSGTITYAFNPANGFTVTQQRAFTACLALWSDEANVTFAQATNASTADVLFSVTMSGGTYDQANPAYTAASGTSGVPTDLTPGVAYGGQGAIAFDNSGGYGTLGSFTAADGYSYGALLHEIGHMIGLGHSGPYNDGNGSAGANLAPALQATRYDSRQWSLMSYIDPDDTTAAYFGSYAQQDTNWAGGAPETPMMLDILAAQRLYGTPVTTALSGGQVFGFNCNITDASAPFFTFSNSATPAATASFAAPVITLWDAGGNNTLDLSGYSTASIVNLNPGTFSSVDGLTNNVGIAFGTAIDTLLGGTGNDTITVNADNDTIIGGGGVDTAVFAGTESQYIITRHSSLVISVADTVTGRNGTDTLVGISRLQFADGLVTLSNAPEKPTDFNGDGGSDILFQNMDGSIAIWQMNGASLAVSSLVSPLDPAWHAVGTGDFNADGHADILFQNQNGSVYVWQMNGASIASAGLAGTPDPSWHTIGTGDFNGDGKSDILFQNDNGSIYIWEMNGTAVATAALVSPLDPAWHAIGTGDFNGDGKSDILFQNDSGGVYIWQMNGTAIASAALVGAPDPSWHALGTGDFDGDGKSDILFQNNNGSIYIWEMNGTAIASAALVSNPGPAWHPVSIGDYNGDGKSDILFQNNNGSLYIWEMNGPSVTTGALVGSPSVAWHALGLNGMHFIDGTQSTGSVAATTMNDDFVFATASAGAHTITGFDPRHDVVTLDQTRFSSYAAVQQNETQAGGGTLINLGSGSTLTIAGVLPTALAAKNFV